MGTSQKFDEFLDVYSLYLATGITWVREELQLKAYELRLMDPSFSSLFVKGIKCLA